LNLFLRRKEDFPTTGRITWVESVADMLGINRLFLRHKPVQITAGPKQLACPCQSKVEVAAPIGAEGWIEEKNVLGQPRRVKLEELLKDDTLSATFHGGDYLKLYLAPWNLHYLVFPAAGQVAYHTYRAGYAIPLVFMKRGDVLNERLCTVIQTEWGFPLALVMIASFLVDGIHHEYQLGGDYGQGAPFGHFKVGSSVVLIAPKNALHWTCQPGQALEIGAPIAEVS